MVLFINILIRWILLHELPIDPQTFINNIDEIDNWKSYLVNLEIMHPCLFHFYFNEVPV